MLIRRHPYETQWKQRKKTMIAIKTKSQRGASYDNTKWSAEIVRVLHNAGIYLYSRTKATPFDWAIIATQLLVPS